MTRERTRADMHHDPQYYRIRNHLVDFLVNRSRAYAGEHRLEHDPRHPPVVRPGLMVPADPQPASSSTPPASPLKQVVNQ
jgi:nitrate/nitrite transport system ATP-binding protein